MKKIGFIGLGHMGTPMVECLLAKNYPVTVYDISKDAVDALSKKGAKVATTLQNIAENSEIIFTMLQTGDQVKQVCLAEDGIFSYAKPGTIYIDSSSIDISDTKALHQYAKETGILMLDAPVSGGVVAANHGALTFMVGGEKNLYSRVYPVLEVMGKKIIYAGEAGLGQAAKICNNLILGISMIAVSEGFNLAEKLGLEPKRFFEIASNASGQCWAMTKYCPVPDVIENVPSNHGYQPGFMAKMMLKDLRLGTHAAETVDAAIPLGGMAAELYDLYVSQGNAETDFSGIIQMISGKMYNFE